MAEPVHKGRHPAFDAGSPLLNSGRRCHVGAWHDGNDDDFPYCTLIVNRLSAFYNEPVPNLGSQDKIFNFLKAGSIAIVLFDKLRAELIETFLGKFFEKEQNCTKIFKSQKKTC